jgi:hypothetical protein
MKPRSHRPAPSTIAPVHTPSPTTVATGGPEPDLLSLFPLVGYQRLAIRVIQLALRDLHCASPELRQTARVFLGGDPLLFLWCDLADIGPARVMARAGHVQPSTPIARLASAKASVS